MLMKPNQFEVAAGAATYERAASHTPGVLLRAVQKLETYFEYRRQRNDLRALDDHLLKDIGISRSEAEQIAAQPFNWRSVPVKMIR